ncbi:hotdog family protein [Gilvimarinus agarilyticus]|uniref:MaoC/PaaZ C-terminal domain-containing protein n=1 Tax=Gilvimarinus agarilyticus TaxID=679259 RepID=UPI000697B875|nr:MaoC/PaaZ C-terminal domain-containing protein [Gilvimarinus agarilyticus]
MLEEFRVEASDLCVQGHFTGYPLVPGAYLLGKVHAYLRERFPEHLVLEIKKVKFLAPVLPGQSVRIDMVDKHWPRVSVQLSGGEGRVLEASVILAAQ